MGLRDLLKKKDDGDDDGGSGGSGSNVPPEFVFMRTDTHTQDVLEPPSGPRDDRGRFLSAGDQQPSKMRRSLDALRSGSGASSGRSRSASASSQMSNGSGSGSSRTRRLSQRLHLSREPETSEYVPENLPEISGDVSQDADAQQLQWEKRATILAEQNARSSPAPSTDAMGRMRLHDAPYDGNQGQGQHLRDPRNRPQSRSRASSQVSSKQIDEDIQEAIRLHEEGDLRRSTQLFKVLADPNGANNPLSQVLYGLALRHGWGCEPNPSEAVRHLTAAASNAASIEELALQAGLKKGGAAKGELVLAIFELANCFRHGWGIEKDAVAAKQYYETAANLGDTDAMNEVAWCYLEGYGCKKDKYAAARYYRLAEKAGSKTIGNSWIWKEKYEPGADGKHGKKK